MPPPLLEGLLGVQVNWQTLWKPRWQRSLREILLFPLIVLIMLVPLGLFTGRSPLHCLFIAGRAGPFTRPCFLTSFRHFQNHRGLLQGQCASGCGRVLCAALLTCVSARERWLRR